jgi:hypothetical protein
MGWLPNARLDQRTLQAGKFINATNEHAWIYRGIRTERVRFHSFLPCPTPGISRNKIDCQVSAIGNIIAENSKAAYD